MQKITGLLSLLLLCACNAGTTSSNTRSDSTNLTSQANVADWKFGVALWTFHNLDFATELDKVDSAGLVYIEPNTFSAIGGAFKDTSMSKATVSAIDRLKEMVAQKGLKVESIYIGGDTTTSSWKHQFDIAKQFGVEFVTTEPPLNMWDAIDSLAGAYNIKVAIHEHWKGMSHYWNPDTTLMAIKGHPNFYVCADLGHWPKSGINPLEAIKKLSGHVLALHFKDIAAYNNPSLKDVPAGTGIIDFPAILSELKKQNFNGHIYIERDSIEPNGNLKSVIAEKKYYDSVVHTMK